MAREYAFVLRTPSRAAAKRLGKRLRAEQFDIDIDDGARSVWCFADSNDSAGQLRDHLTRLARDDMVGPPVPLVWRGPSWATSIRRPAHVITTTRGPRRRSRPIRSAGR